MTTKHSSNKMHDIFLRALLFTFLLIAVSFCNGQVQSQKAVHETVNPYIGGYYESLPLDYATSGKKYPVLIFLHGLGEVGDGSPAKITSVLRNGPPKIINDGQFPASFNVNNENFSFIVISPQLNSNIRNSSVVSTLIDFVVKKYRVDIDRIYLTGLSMGGGISWIYAGDKPEFSKRLAGMAVVCGNTNAFTSMAKNIAGANLPVLITHNEGDPTVPSSNSKNWQAMLTGISPKMDPQPILNVFAGENSHDAWSKTYDLSYSINGRNVYEHLLQYSRKMGPSLPPPNQSPVVTVGPPGSIVLPVNSFSVSGQATDPDGSIVSYRWVKKSGPAQYKIDQTANANTLISDLVAGIYEFELTAIDNNGASGTALAKITVLPQPIIIPVPNKPPTVDAGNDKILRLPINSLELLATANDPDGAIVSQSWKKLKGPSSLTIENPLKLKTIVSDLSEGAYTFEITVTDNQQSNSTDIVSVVVDAPLPVAPAVVDNCGCTTTLKTAPDGGIYANGSGSKPGDKVCIAAGTYKYINLSNFNGTASNPITIVNCGGQVVVTGYTYGFSITASSFFRLTGTGVGGIDYGFKVDGVSEYIPSGLGVSRKSTDFEVDHVEFTKCDVGVICKTNPTCDAETWDAAFAMRNLSFHDLYLHDIHGEGFYVGHTSHQIDLTCNGQSTTVKPQRIFGLKIYNCRVDGTGWDGIQIANAPENVQLYNNTVNNFGTRNQSSQQAGILFGGLSNGNAYNNHISNGTGNGIQVLGVGRIQIYNNVVVNTGGNAVESASKDGIFIDDRPAAGYPALYVWVSNNTVISSKRSAIRMENTNKTIVSMNEFRNNLMAASGEPNVTFQGVVVRNSAANTTIGNVYRQSVNDIKFAGSNDYHLTASSPAVDAGEAVNTLGILADKDGANRSQGSKPDAGAYEFAGAAQPPANIAPVAIAGVDKTITLPINTVTVSGSGTDSDGSITVYSWKKISGPASFDIKTETSASTNISFVTAGEYEFELTVTDNKGATGKDVVKITVLPVLVFNQPPIANAGTSQTITLPTNTLIVAGSGTDSDGSITAYSWKKVRGPASFNIAAVASASTSISALTTGEYEFELTVTDNKGATGKDIVNVTVLPAATLNQPPVANAGANQIISLPTNMVTVFGSGTDIDGNIATYSWKKVSGPATFDIMSSASATTKISSFTAGEYEFELTVTDDDGATGKDIVKISVLSAIPSNLPPVANAGTGQTITLPTNTTTLVGSGTDSDGSITAYSWKKLSGPASFEIITAASAITKISSLVAGEYEFEITVTDDDGATAKDIVKITVMSTMPTNQPPIANAGPDQVVTLPTNTLTLVGTGIDIDGNITAYSWKKLSGPANFDIISSGSATTKIASLTTGDYEFELTVTDDDGATGKDLVQVTILASIPSNLPPVAYAGIDQAITLPKNTIELSGRGTDIDGHLVSYSWKKISGPSCTIINVSAATTNVIDLVKGVYEFELTVIDDKGSSATDLVSISVKDVSLISRPGATNLPPIILVSDTTLTFPVNQVELSALKSFDPEKGELFYRWKQLTGPDVVRITPLPGNNGAVIVISDLQIGKYTLELTVTDVQGLESKRVVTVEVVNNFRYKEAALIYPNPVRDNLNCIIFGRAGEAFVTIIDNNGRIFKIFKIELKTGVTKFSYNVGFLKAGVYILNLQYPNGAKKSMKFVKRE